MHRGGKIPGAIVFASLLGEAISDYALAGGSVSPGFITVVDLSGRHHIETGCWIIFQPCPD
jgi:hypothetical protein